MTGPPWTRIPQCSDPDDDRSNDFNTRMADTARPSLAFHFCVWMHTYVSIPYRGVPPHYVVGV